MIALMLIGWIYVVVRCIFEWVKGTCEDVDSRDFAHRNGCSGYFDHRGRYIKFNKEDK